MNFSFVSFVIYIYIFMHVLETIARDARDRSKFFFFVDYYFGSEHIMM